MHVNDLLRRARSEGRIVFSGDLSLEQVADARAEGRFSVDDDGFGYVLLPWELTAIRDVERENAGGWLRRLGIGR